MAIDQVKGADQGLAEEQRVPGRDPEVPRWQALAQGAGMDADGQAHGFAAQEDHGVAAAADPTDGAWAIGGGDDVARGEGFDGAVAIGGGDAGAGEDADDAVGAEGPIVDSDGAGLAVVAAKGD